MMAMRPTPLDSPSIGTSKPSIRRVSSDDRTSVSTDRSTSPEASRRVLPVAAIIASTNRGFAASTSRASFARTSARAWAGVSPHFTNAAAAVFTASSISRASGTCRVSATPPFAGSTTSIRRAPGRLAPPT